MQNISEEWLRRVEAEYRSAAMAQHYTLWLIQVGASPDLIRDGLRIVDDELKHAELSHEVYREAGGTAVPNLDRDSLGLTRKSDDLYADLLRVAVSFFCLGETVAVPLFQRMRKTCTIPCAKDALDRIVVDEVRHRDFGWTLLDWLLETAPELKPVLQANLPKMVEEIAESYASDPDDGQITPLQRQWGLISRAEYAEVFTRSCKRDYRPRFAKCEIEFSGEVVLQKKEAPRTTLHL